MWFHFPVGATHITVEQQVFQTEAVDTEGRNCFQAPAHFAPRILAIAGFGMAGEITNAPPDRTGKTTDDSQAVIDLTRQLDAAQGKVKDLLEDHNRLQAAHSALTAQHEALKKELAETDALLSEVEAQCEEKGFKPISKMSPDEIASLSKPPVGKPAAKSEDKA